MNFLIIGSGATGEAPTWAEYLATSDKFEKIYIHSTTPYISTCMNSKIEMISGDQINDRHYDYYWGMDSKEALYPSIKINCDNVIGNNKTVATLEVDKWIFKETCYDRKIPTPSVLMGGEPLDLKTKLLNVDEWFTYPIVIKPYHEMNGVRSDVYNNQTDAINFLNKMENEFPFDKLFVEEYIHDALHLEICFVADGEGVYSLGTSAEYKNWLGNPDKFIGGWVSYATSPCSLTTKEHEDFLVDCATKLFETGIPKGIYCIQGLATADKMYLLELNARPGAGDMVTLWNNTDAFDFISSIHNGSFKECPLDILGSSSGVHYGMFTILNKQNQSALINITSLVPDQDKVIVAPYNILYTEGYYYSAPIISPIMVGIIGTSEKEVIEIARERIPIMFNRDAFNYDLD